MRTENGHLALTVSNKISSAHIFTINPFDVRISKSIEEEDNGTECIFSWGNSF